MKNNFYLTFYVTTALFIAVTIFMPTSFTGFICGLFYAQLIEWFVHGWVQHQSFKIFKPYQANHDYHHQFPDEKRSVQPILYFLIGSVVILSPWYWFDGFAAGYLHMYLWINVIHYDLHTTQRLLPKFIWNTPYFKKIESHHKIHHMEDHLGHHQHTSFSVTNPYLDYFFDKIKLTRLNNFIAKKLKI